MNVFDGDGCAAKGAFFLSYNNLFDAIQAAVVLTIAQHHGDTLSQIVLVCAQLALDFALQV